MNKELDERVGEQTRMLRDQLAQRETLYAELASEFSAAERLQHVSTQLITARGTEALYEQILDTALAVLHADFASIQQFYPDRGSNGELRLLGHRGFSAEAAKRWEWVGPATRTTCGEALRTGRRVVVADVRKCDFMAGSEDLDGYLGAEIRAGLTTPLFSRSGVLLGMVSAYWCEPHDLNATELRTLDVLARLAADLIERSRAEEAVRRSEERFRNLADTAPAMIWVTGLDKLCTFVNQRWLDFVGHTMEQQIGSGWTDSVHPQDLDRCLTTYSLSFDARRSFQMEYRLRRADGEYRWVLDNGSPFYREGEFAGYVGSCIDITEQKGIEERLRGSETRLKDAQRLAKVGSWERDESGNGYWSDEMFRIYGLRNGAAPSFPALVNCVSPEDRQILLEAHERVRSSDAPLDIEFRIIRPDGEVRWVRTVLESVRDNRGVVVRTVGATQDVTDLKRAQEENFARQKLETVGTLASGIAHDFNNLLGGVLAQIELAQAECTAGSYPDEELKLVEKLALRGSEIVRQLMIYAGKEAQVSTHIDVSQVVEEMLALLRFSVSKHAALETHLGKDLPPVRGSAAQLRQVVMNLVTNASEALGDQDGVIRVTTGRATVDRAAAVSEGVPEGEYLQLEVSDTGSGMPPEMQARVFDPFFTTKSSGRGLGLSVVHGIVRNFDGVMHLASHPGKGTTFRILLPCAEPTSETTADSIPRAKDPTQLSHGATVLVVEDEDPLREAVAKLLRKSGFEVLEAANGTAAIDLLRANGTGIDIILLDMTMPGPSSYEVVAEAAQTRHDVKVILTSAYTEELAANMWSPQIRGFLRKPFRHEDLVETLGSVLSSQATAEKTGNARGALCGETQLSR